MWKVGRMEHLIISSSRCPDSFMQHLKELGLILPAGDSREINNDSIHTEFTEIYKDHLSSALPSSKCPTVL